MRHGCGHENIVRGAVDGEHIMSVKSFEGDWIIWPSGRESFANSCRILSSPLGWSLPAVNHTWEKAVSREDITSTRLTLFQPVVTGAVAYITENGIQKYEDNSTECYLLLLSAEIIWSLHNRNNYYFDTVWQLKNIDQRK